MVVVCELLKFLDKFSIPPDCEHSTLYPVMTPFGFAGELHDSVMVLELLEAPMISVGGPGANNMTISACLQY